MIAFGPIPSRRLGKSLGINNIVSHKVCSYNCVYCQIGDTKKKSAVRLSFYEPQKLVQEVAKHINKLDKNHIPDYLTFVANGEPTLDINLGREIKLLKRFGIPIAVITNSSLIYDKAVQDDLMEADWVSVKIDTVDKTVWNKINRPVAEINFEKIIEGLTTFSSGFKGKLHTETMLVAGLNDSSGHLGQNASFIASLKPKIAYLSIPTRPPAVKEVKPVSEEKVTETWQVYHEAGITTELLTGFEGTDTGFTGNAYEDILNITAVHPLREDTIANLLKQNNTGISVIESLLAQELIKSVIYKEKKYYIRNYHF
ncbi:MAG: radical SAM protein [Bacteroidales bacterium]|nr:radical SAM protein [Bacteroidales bacterium]